MQADINLETGTVTAEFTLAEYQEIIDALAARKGTKPARPAEQRVFEFDQESDTTPGRWYHQTITLDAHGNKTGTCTCPHNRFRKEWCKHLTRAGLLLVRQLAALS